MRQAARTPVQWAWLALAWAWLATGLWGGSLVGTAHDRQGEPLADRQLVLVRMETGETTPVSTSSEGEFSAELPSGVYRIYLEDVDQGQLIREVAFKATGQQVLRLQLPPSRRLDSGSGDSTDPSQAGLQDGGKRHALEEIAEYRIHTSQFHRLPGRSASLQEMINPFPSRPNSGFHGSIYEFHRNDNLDARNFFDALSQPLPEFKRNQFGAEINASRGRWEFLAAYEGLRVIRGSTLVSHVPTVDMKGGDFGALSQTLIDPLTGNPFPDNRIPTDRIHPVARGLLPLIPDPVRDDPLRNLVNNSPSITNGNSLHFRTDYEPDDRSKTYLRYEIENWNGTDPRTLPTFNRLWRSRNTDASLGYTRSLSTRWIVNSRLEFDRDWAYSLSEHAGTAGLVESLGIAGISAIDADEEGYPDFQLSGYAPLGDGSDPRTRVRNELAMEGSLSYAFEGHDLRMGLEFEADQRNNYRRDPLHRGRFLFSGLYTGDAFGDFLLGLPNRATRGVGLDRSDLRGQTWEAFFRDTWRVGPRLDLSLGLNYHYMPPLRSIHDNLATFHPLLTEPTGGGELVVAGSPEARSLGLPSQEGGLVFPDRNDWAPRLGFAYSPFGGQRLVIRGTYSVYYSTPHSTYFVTHLGRNYPFYYVESAEAAIDTAGLDLSKPFDTATTEATIRGIEPRMRNAEIQFRRISLEREIARHWTLKVRYINTQATHLARVLPGNIPRPGPGPIQARRPDPDFGRFSIVTSSGASNGHGLELEAERRMARGLALKSGFRWNRRINDLFRDEPSNPRDLRAERGPADFLPNRRLFVNYILDLPFGRTAAEESDWRRLIRGWRLSGITKIQDGAPFSVVLPGDYNNDGLSNDRADRLGVGVLGTPSVDGWFEVSDFATPAPYSFGDSGRNILRAPAYQNWDVSLIKQTQLKGGDVVELRVEFFNAFNQVNFEEPNSVLGTSGFGSVFGAKRAREIEVAFKYSF